MTTTAPALLCVRCGRFLRSATPYLCQPCATDPRMRAEIATAETVSRDVLAQRRFVIEQFGWAGGWGRSHPWNDPK